MPANQPKAADGWDPITFGSGTYAWVDDTTIPGADMSVVDHEHHPASRVGYHPPSMPWGWSVRITTIRGTKAEGWAVDAVHATACARLTARHLLSLLVPDKKRSPHKKPTKSSKVTKAKAVRARKASR